MIKGDYPYIGRITTGALNETILVQI